MHQLTDLSFGFEPHRRDETLRRNALIRTEGTRNLAAAATAAARRLIVQSIAWVYAPGPAPHREDDPLTTPGPIAGRPPVASARSRN